jgi:hypothetical protein
MRVTSKFLNLLKRFEALSVFEELVLKGVIIKHIKIIRNSIFATVIVRTISMSEKAFSYENRDALNWIKDKNFKRYLGLILCYRHRSAFLIVCR